MSVMQVTVTAPSDDIAQRLAGGLISARLAACAQVSGPVTSVYRWEGKVETDTEWRVDIKTTQRRLDAVVDHIVQNHPYDVPEVIAVSVTGGHGRYLDWVEEETV